METVLTIGEIRSAPAAVPEGRTRDEAEWATLSTAWRPRLDNQIAMRERLRDRLQHCIGCGCLSLRFCAVFNPDDIAGRRSSGARYVFDVPGVA